MTDIADLDNTSHESRFAWLLARLAEVSDEVLDSGQGAFIYGLADEWSRNTEGQEWNLPFVAMTMAFRRLLLPDGQATTGERYWRVQPNGRSLFGHSSKLGAEPVRGLFAFANPETLFDTFTWIHVRKRIDSYQMVEFEGFLATCPDDSEGVVVIPAIEVERVPLADWLRSVGRE
jgi:hypothetical protein